MSANLNFVLLHINECRQQLYVNRTDPCRRTPIAICIVEGEDESDNLMPICLDCIYNCKVPQKNLLPLSQFVGIDIDTA